MARWRMRRATWWATPRWAEGQAAVLAVASCSGAWMVRWEGAICGTWVPGRHTACSPLLPHLQGGDLQLALSRRGSSEEVALLAAGARAAAAAVVAASLWETLVGRNGASACCWTAKCDNLPCCCPALLSAHCLLSCLVCNPHLTCLPPCPALPCYAPEFRQLDEQLVAMAAAVDSNEALFIDDAELAKVRRMWCGSCGA